MQAELQRAVEESHPVSVRRVQNEQNFPRHGVARRA